MTAVITIVTRSHLHLARTLMRSVATVLPEAERHVLVVDPADGAFDPAAEPFSVTFASELGLPRFEEMAFVNEARALCCLLKPAFARHVLTRSGSDEVIYADSDVLFYARPTALLDALNHSPAVVTPHALSPLGDAGARTDVDIMRAGAINAGLFAVRRSDEAMTFLEWWLDGMRRERQLDRDLLDQLWLNLALVYFPWLSVFRDSGYNVAYWNISQRPLARAPDGGLTAGGSPLVAFHYSFFSPATPELLANRPPLVVSAGTELMRDLLRDYAARQADAGAAHCKRWSYAYHQFTDGKPITAEHRKYYLERIWHDPDHRGSVFTPEFVSRNYRGLKSVHALDRWVTRSIRAVRRRVLPAP